MYQLNLYIYPNNSVEETAVAFFDDLGKKISQASQSVVQKTQGMSEVSRLNAVIGDAEKQIESCYLQIGKLYVAMHAADHEPDFTGMVNTIREAEARIRDSKEQIQLIKGLVKCEKCGAFVESSVAFCSTCGAAMPRRLLDENTIRCTSCGQLVPKEMRFCTACGKPTVDILQTVPVTAPVAEPIVDDVTVVAPEQTAQVEQTAPAARFCTECGTAVEAGAAFCVECGTKL